MARLAVISAGIVAKRVPQPQRAASVAARAFVAQRAASTHTTTPPTPLNAGTTPPVTPSVPPKVKDSIKPSSFSTSSSHNRRRGSPLGKIASYTLFLFGSTFLVSYYLDARSAIHRWVAMPFLHTFLDPEEAQKLAIKLLKSGVAPKDYTGDDQTLESELFGLPLVNPIGLAAGFDKQAEAIDGLYDLGFGLVEIGSVTPKPQPGNPQPRYFRLPQYSAAINRFGFNSDGHEVVLERLLERVRDHLVRHPHLIPSNYLPDPRSPDADPRISRRDAVVQAAESIAKDPAAVAAVLDHHGLPRSLRQGRLLSINLGKNKTSAEEDPSDFVRGVETFGPLADYLVINVSSPNTPGLRDLQKRDSLQRLLRQVVIARDRLPQRKQGGDARRRVPLVLKISPDLSQKEMDEVASVITESKGIDGVIISNTTTSRPVGTESWPLSAESSEWATLREAGGLSGPPLRPLARQALQQVVGRLRGSGIEVLAAGGITTPEDVIQATVEDGASAVQVYTAFGWQGVGMVSRWKEEIRGLLTKKSGQVPQTSDSKDDRAGRSTTYKFLLHQRHAALKKSEEERRAKAEQDLKNGVRAELEELRKEFGSTDKKEGDSQSVGGVFWPEEKDALYNELLTKTRVALGLSEPSRPVKDDHSARRQDSAVPQQPPKKATITNDVVPPTMILSSTSADGAVGSSTSPTEDKATDADRTVEVVGVIGQEHLRKSSTNKTSGTSASKEWKEWLGIDKERRV